MFPLGTRVKMHFEGELEDGSIFFSTRLQGSVPYEFRIGQREILPALEERLREMSVGDRATITIPAAEAYGVYDESLKERVPAYELPNIEELPVGDYVVFSTPDGPLRVKVESIEDGVVTFDYNHELAGHDLTFHVDILGAMDENNKVDVECYFANADDNCGCHSLKEHAHHHEGSGHEDCCS